MMKALAFSRFGDPSVLEYIDVEMPKIKSNEVLVQMKSIGLNYADIYRRKGNYHLKGDPPYIAGYEGSGVVVNSNGLNNVKIGDRVAFADVPFANAQYVAVSYDHLIPLPDDISFDQAASVLLQGMTAHYLSHDSYLVKPKDIVLVHAASGGVGQILLQLCKQKQAVVVGLTTSDLKKDKVLSLGADAVFNLKTDWKKAVLDFAGDGFDVVYDSVGSTLMDSIAVTKERGNIVFYGMSGGDPEPVNPRVLMDGSKTLTGGDLWSYLKTKQDRVSRAHQLFDLIKAKQLALTEPVKYALAEGAVAHQFLENGKSSGKILLVP